MLESQSAEQRSEISLEGFSTKLTQIYDEVDAKGGGIYLKSFAELKDIPLKEFPAFMLEPLEDDLALYSEKTGANRREILKKTLNQIERDMYIWNKYLDDW